MVYNTESGRASEWGREFAAEDPSAYIAFVSAHRWVTMPRRERGGAMRCGAVRCGAVWCGDSEEGSEIHADGAWCEMARVE